MNVVIVDDSKTVILTITALLENLGVDEESIFAFMDAAKALAFIQMNGADIIFSDIQMPGMDGFEFVNQLLNLSKQYVSTLFIVSADEHHDNVTRMKLAGGKRFIRKPINANHFNHFVIPELAKLRKRNFTEVKSKIELPSQESRCDIELNKKFDFKKITEADYDVIALQMGIKPKHVPMLIKSFFSEASLNISHLKEAIDSQNYAQIERYAHSLKGSAGNMKFNDVYEIFKTMEEAAQAQDADYLYAKSLETTQKWVLNHSELFSI